MKPHRCAVVGGGVIGVAVARELTRRLPGATVTVFEKEAGLASHQTGHNSGVIHAGLYYEPGGLKAQLCRRGVGLLKRFCEERAIAVDECGKVVVAQNDVEMVRLDEIARKAKANGVPGVRLIGGEELREVEPYVTGRRALHSPHTAIVDYVAVTMELARDIEDSGGSIRCGHEVTSIAETVRGVEVRTPDSAEEFDLAVTCAGLQSDRVARTAGDPKSPRIIPFFGDYVLLSPEKRHLVKGLVYPVPDPKYPFLGVHLTRRIDGEIMLGPNAFLSPGREAYRWSQARPADVVATMAFPGFWRFAAHNVPTAVRESATVLSRRRFVANAARYVPGIGVHDVVAGGRGIRAQAMAANGDLIDDFAISGGGRITHVRNAPSPGATSSMAIAEYVVARVLADAGPS
ncbi:L-2-hydroxyglutarate oxidase [Mycobacterium sp. NPDC003449]